MTLLSTAYVKNLSMANANSQQTAPFLMTKAKFDHATNSKVQDIAGMAKSVILAMTSRYALILIIRHVIRVKIASIGTCLKVVLISIWVSVS